MEQLKPRFSAAAAKIKKALEEHRPLILRHHADADGISAALIIERVCRSMIPDKGRNIDKYVMRKPSHVPFYDATDALRDISLISRFMLPRNQDPLIVLLDIGSTADDRPGVDLIRSYGFEAIVIDHHKPPRESLDTDMLHCNPYLVGLDHAITTSMMAFEIAGMIDPDSDETLLADIGAVGDRAEPAHHAPEMLKKYNICFDFLGYHLFEPCTFCFERILEDERIADEIVKSLELDAKLQSIESSIKVEEDSDKLFAYVELDSLPFRYPPPGKICGMVFSRLAKKGKEILVLGLVNDSVIVRQKNPLYPVERMIADVAGVARASGGGHDVAGTFRYFGISRKEVLDLIRKRWQGIRP